MSDIIIHHIKLTYDETDERVRDFVKHLKADKEKEDMEQYYLEAMMQKEGKLNIEDMHGNEFTFYCQQGHMCRVGLRGM
ncbi:MAG TPA: hypothetical protein VFQ59_03210 [Candidatus Paceibacterota bacterium]|nr:hypothetical protein [Candidatus Paceibacterota bacterium]